MVSGKEDGFMTYKSVFVTNIYFHFFLTGLPPPPPPPSIGQTTVPQGPQMPSGMFDTKATDVF